mmetsp:Transcript_54364/g.168304  ORF Transcript_54364/g.168304 Transcript_54364/m.168304 type:complete len:246 (+) Transcript_54364:401-1138(+)
MSMTFSRPQVPAFASSCPTCDFAVQWSMGRSRLLNMTPLLAPTSMGSPSAVPVPWHSPSMTSDGLMLASRRDCLMHSCCEGPCGAVRLALRPSWFTQLPMTVHRGRSEGSATWSSWWLRRYAAQQPSPRMKPSALESKVKHLPRNDNIVAAHSPIQPPGCTMHRMPMQTPYCNSSSGLWYVRGIWPSFLCVKRRIMCAQEFAATRDAEQAVSTETLGPVRLSRPASRVQVTALRLQLATYLSCFQ